MAIDDLIGQATLNAQRGHRAEWRGLNETNVVDGETYRDRRDRVQQRHADMLTPE